MANYQAISIHIELKKLIELKSQRDQIKFTAAQLANALNMPRSMITKLTHPDLLKRVINPRIDTLLEIVEFFKEDGFNINIDNLLGTKNLIDIQDQVTPSQIAVKTIPLFSFDSDMKNQLGVIDINLSSDSKNMVALLSDHDIKPLFKK